MSSPRHRRGWSGLRRAKPQPQPQPQPHFEVIDDCRVSSHRNYASHRLRHVRSTTRWPSQNQRIFRLELYKRVGRTLYVCNLVGGNRMVDG
ncbi:hypothetical protein E4U54_001351 [Claviceps lovelessii]|nr:hypothetical protein E4U54_001351 [Claviceps lovelessii]